MKVSPHIAGSSHRLGAAVLGLAALSICLAMALRAVPAQAATCPNEALRLAQNATDLPGCMALEKVSPAKKSSQRAFLPSFSRDGERVRFRAEAALGGTPGYQFALGGDTYIATRGPSGWTTHSTVPPDTSLLGGGPRFANPATFAPDLDRWTQLGSTQAQYQVGVTRLFAGGLDGSFDPLSPLLNPIEGGNAVVVDAMEVSGSSVGLEVTVLRSSASYLAEGSGRNYLAFLDEGGEPTLVLLARDKDGVLWDCGAHLGGDPQDGQSIEAPTLNQGAISQDGSRIYFSARPAQPCDTANPLRILRRDETQAGPAIIEIAPPGGWSHRNGRRPLPRRLGRRHQGLLHLAAQTCRHRQRPRRGRVRCGARQIQRLRPLSL
jgi:hypothetical protein